MKAGDFGLLTLIQSWEGLNRSGPISPCSKGARWMPSARRACKRARLVLRSDRFTFVTQQFGLRGFGLIGRRRSHPPHLPRNPLAERLSVCRLHEPQHQLPLVSVFMTVHGCFKVRRGNLITSSARRLSWGQVGRGSSV
jgi:hypothetical protein